MTGKITVGTIQDTAGTTIASTFVTSGVAKAWVDFEGSSTIDKSLNMSTITDNGTGDYTLTYTTAFDSLNYIYNGSCAINTTSNAVHMLNQIDAAGGRLAGSLRVESFYTNSSNNRPNFDAAHCNALFHGDLT